MDALPPKTFSLVVAATSDRGIGANGTIPWRLPTDLKFFRSKTTVAPQGQQNAVVMGRLTYESMPPKFRPLPGRLNVVISRNSNYKTEANLPAEVLVASSFEESLKMVQSQQNIAEIFVIGGGLIFNEAILHPQCHTIFYTKLKTDFPCTVFFPEIDPKVYTVSEEGPTQTENGIDFQFQTFQRKA